jgi:hypothetical protein
VCIPGSSSRGSPQSCDLNGCAGGYDVNSNTARCRGNFSGCVCNPTANTCGAPQSCDAGGCGGSINNVQTKEATCKTAYTGCACIASGSTPVNCGTLGSCSFSDCNGYAPPGNNIGTCTGGSHAGCGCIPSAPSCPLGGPPSADCLDVIQNIGTSSSPLYNPGQCYSDGQNTWCDFITRGSCQLSLGYVYAQGNAL